MNRFKQLSKLWSKERGISEHVGITHLNDSTVFETRQGMMGCVLRLQGIDFVTASQEVLTHYRDRFHQIFHGLGEPFCLYVTLHRHQHHVHLAGQFRDPFTQQLNQHYHRQFHNRRAYNNAIYLTLIHKGKRHLTKHTHSFNRSLQRNELKDLAKKFKIMLDAFKPSILGDQDHQCGFSELLRFLTLWVNGGQSIPLKYSAGMSALPVVTVGQTPSNIYYPYAHLSYFLSSKHIMFGDYIQFQGATPDDIRFGVIVSIKRYSPESDPTMFDALLNLDSEFISTHVFDSVNHTRALNLLQRQINKMKNLGDPAHSHIEQLKGAKDQLACHEITMGHHYHTLMLLAPSKEQVDEQLGRIIRCFSDTGVIAVRESVAQEPAFWSQIPTNMHYIPRFSLIHSRNFVDFCPLHNNSSGYFNCNHLGTAVTLLETSSRTPYFFNYHRKSSPGVTSRGHTMVIGGSGSGKTVFLTFMDAQIARYQGRTFYFDRDRSAERYIKARQGQYCVFSPQQHLNPIALNPLQLEDTPAHRQFCYRWLAQLCKHPEETTPLNADLMAPIRRCIDYSYMFLAKKYRTLSHLFRFLPIHFPRKNNLFAWMQDVPNGQPGPYAYLFDHAQDQLKDHDITGFDVTHFLNHEPIAIRTSLMMYLFHRIDLSLDHRLTSIVLDEGWQYLDDPLWRTRLERWLPTLRKRNAHIIMATQSAAGWIHSSIGPVLLDNIATQIFFTNNRAQPEHYMQPFNLTQAEFNLIRQSDHNERFFLVKHDNQSAWCRINLSNMEHLLLTLSSDPYTSTHPKEHQQ